MCVCHVTYTCLNSRKGSLTNDDFRQLLTTPRYTEDTNTTKSVRYLQSHSQTPLLQRKRVWE